jgi:glycosyltransferase involved in cell wall biosynthesis
MGVAIGVMFPGDPTAPGTWSGTPSGIIRGLQELGVEVHGINVDAPRRVSRWFSFFAGATMLPSIARTQLPLSPREVRRVGLVSPAVAAMRSAVAQRRLAASVPLDGLIQIGAGFSVKTDVPLVTFEDMTGIQARAASYPEWLAMSDRAVAARVSRQRGAYQRARACCATTHWAADSIVSDYDVPAEKVHVVGVGRNHAPAGTALKRSWSPPRLLFVGRDWDRKNGARVVRAFERLRLDVPDARLDLVGDHPPLEADGIVGHGVLRLGTAADRTLLLELFARATCFVMPSLTEPSALAYVEASAYGLPSVVTSQGGSTELVGDGGVVVDPRDDDGLLEALRTLCDPETAARLGQLAQARSQLFTSRAMAGRLLRALALPSIDTETLPAFL